MESKKRVGGGSDVRIRSSDSAFRKVGACEVEGAKRPSERALDRLIIHSLSPPPYISSSMRNWACLLLLLVPCTRAGREGMPPVGGVYGTSLLLPVLGKQRLRLSIVSEERATIEMSGALSLLAEEVNYTSTHDGSFDFDLGPNARALLGRVRTSLRSAVYDAEADCAYVRVKPPIVPEMHVGLEREEEGTHSLLQ